MQMLAVAVAASSLIGLWKSDDNYIEFRPYKDHLRVEGSAVWPGRTGGRREDGYEIFPHYAEFSGQARQVDLSFETLRRGDGRACRIWGRLSGRKLIVHDDYKCGANNASFNGVFVRAPKTERIPEYPDSVRGDPPRWKMRPRD